MSTGKLSDCFRLNFVFLKIFGIWPGRVSNKSYKFYSILFMFITWLTYNMLLILNLIYTPRKIELLIREVIFMFTEIAVTSKVFMILVMRYQLVAAFDILDCEAFKGEDDAGRQIVREHVSKYKTYWKIYAILSNFAYSSQVFLPLFRYSIFRTNLELPICKYYFLEEEVVIRYFTLLFIYQAAGMYGHMTYNVNIDTLIAGLILMAITQMRVLNNELKALITKKSVGKDTEIDAKLIRCLKHYDLILTFCTSIQNIFSVTMFVQFGIASAIICVILCGFILASSTETQIFMVLYLCAMVLQIFGPAWLGTQMTFESQELVFAAYCSDWIPRTETFKRSIRLFVERANTKIMLTGLGMFPLSLETFTSIIKTAYSFFTLIRNFQDRQD